MKQLAYNVAYAIHQPGFSYDNMNLRIKLDEIAIKEQEKERKRLGQELHDNVNQLLATAKLFLDRVKTIGDESFEFKTKVSQYLQSAFDEIRSLSHGLATPHFENTSLTDSFKRIVNDIKLSGAFSIFSDLDKKAELLDNSIKLHLFRIFQEQIKNTVRYSHATLVQVRLKVAGGHVRLTIKDNGVGFDLSKKGDGSGLSNIYDRVALCQGTAKITTAPGRGCKLGVLIPIGILKKVKSSEESAKAHSSMGKVVAF